MKIKLASFSLIGVGVLLGFLAANSGPRSTMADDTQQTVSKSTTSSENSKPS
ncbi:MAG: hypothetical protein K0U86_11680 [Planctomycetes bacterium]|nr:hypothetical protein [Planctomycetota bacterium]MCH9725543.1 hypothetical protein [Planctomycetota bacterium]MCH9776464.1 hypothetical protein [Planctomycetota bacterium]MCH9790630.1 hypothetical protein [Planctomycetota bacterium]